MIETLVQLVLCFTALFIILLVLVQRGRGGGLAGALGGPGGSSAFGAKAGDVFTKITVWSATIWILLCVVATFWANNRGDAFGQGGGRAFAGQPAAISDESGAAGEEGEEGEEEPGATSVSAVEEEPSAE